MVDELQAGANVTPSVRLVRPLAQGGMGTVWIAEHLVLDTNVVVKLMAKELESSAEGAARFAREAAVAAAVKSPHVVQVFDSGVTKDGVAYIVMELLEGHDLGAEITAKGRMAPHTVAVVVAQLAKALAKAHRVGVVHRDLKPDNVFLCDVEGGEPFVKLLDFGTAKDEKRAAPYATTLGQLIGTPYYMSPEQILGEEIDARSDIWSLGVLAFEALTGRRPFEGITVGAITLAIHTTVPRMTDVVPELPAALDDWFALCCARDAAERFQNARAAANAFARALGGDALPDSDRALESFAGPRSSDSSSALGIAQRVVTPSDRIATSLSSTLSAPRSEHRTMTWIAGGVGVAAIAGMFALINQDDPRPSTAASSPSVTAPLPSPLASTSASAHPSPPAIASPPATTASSEPLSPSASVATAFPLPSSQSATPSAHASSPPVPSASHAPSARATASAPMPPSFPLPSASASSAAPARSSAPTPAPPPPSALPSAPPPAAAPVPDPAPSPSSPADELAPTPKDPPAAPPDVAPLPPKGEQRTED
jgi:serine/threonine-protein kinase